MARGRSKVSAFDRLSKEDQQLLVTHHPRLLLNMSSSLDPDVLQALLKPIKEENVVSRALKWSCESLKRIAVCAFVFLLTFNWLSCTVRKTLAVLLYKLPVTGNRLVLMGTIGLMLVTSMLDRGRFSEPRHYNIAVFLSPFLQWGPLFVFYSQTESRCDSTILTGTWGSVEFDVHPLQDASAAEAHLYFFGCWLFGALMVYCSFRYWSDK